jgi:hypothetical protein
MQDEDEIIEIEEDFVSTSELINTHLECTRHLSGLLFPDGNVVGITDATVFILCSAVQLAIFIAYVAHTLR